MVNTVFSDNIINPTELKKNQRHWLDKAQTNPVTVTFGDSGLAIVNRDLIKNLYAEKHYAELFVRYCKEMADSKGKSSVFPWLSTLPENDQKEFHDEFVATFIKAGQENSWNEMGQLLEDWKATAEAYQNPEFMEAVRNRGKSEDYISLERPTE